MLIIIIGIFIDEKLNLYVCGAWGWLICWIGSDWHVCTLCIVFLVRFNMIDKNLIIFFWGN